MRDHDKITGRDRTKQRLELYAAYLTKLGAPLDLLGHIRVHWQDSQRMARPIEKVEGLLPGAHLRFKHFSAEVLHLPGHTPGLVCLWDSEHGVLFSDDHLLERVSPNPLLDLEDREAPVHRALIEYVRSAKRVRELPVELVAPGHAEPFSGHVELIDRLLGFYETRQQKLLAILRGGGSQTPAELSPQIFPRAREHQLYLTLSEVMGNLEVLEDKGSVKRFEQAGRIRFEAV